MIYFIIILSCILQTLTNGEIHQFNQVRPLLEENNEISKDSPPSIDYSLEHPEDTQPEAIQLDFPEQLTTNIKESIDTNLASNQKNLWPIEIQSEESTHAQFLANDDEIRAISNLDFKSPCRTEFQFQLDDPPDTSPLNFDFENAIKWQRQILSLCPPLRPCFCNFSLFLTCLNNECRCRHGLIYDSKLEICAIPLGSNCEFENPQNHPMPKCISGTECAHRFPFVKKKCWCESSSKNCHERSIFSTSFPYNVLSERLRNKFTLKYEEDCKQECEQNVLDPGSPDIYATIARVRYLESTINLQSLSLCNFASHLICSPLSKCSCPKSHFFQRSSGTCLALRAQNCGLHSLQNTVRENSGLKIWQFIQQPADAMSLSVKCIQNAYCFNSTFCRCKNGFGERCERPSSIFTKVLLAPINSVENRGKLKEFDEFFDSVNEDMLGLEGGMKIEFGCECHPSNEKELDAVVKFWKVLRKSKAVFESMGEMEEILKIVKRLKVESFCNRTAGLTCNERLRSCTCRKGTFWQDWKCRIQAGESCGTILPCVNFASCRENICRCDLESGSRTICNSPEDLNKAMIGSALDNSNSKDIRHSNLSPFQNSADMNKKEENEADRALFHNLGFHVSKTPLREFEKKLGEILFHRTLPLATPCHPASETSFRNLLIFYSTQLRADQFQNIKKSNLPSVQDLKKAQKDITDKFNKYKKILKRLFNNGMRFCDLSKSLACSNITSECTCAFDVNCTQENCRSDIRVLQLYEMSEILKIRCRLPQGAICTMDEETRQIRWKGEFLRENEEIILLTKNIFYPSCDEGLLCKDFNGTLMSTCEIDEKFERKKAVSYGFLEKNNRFFALLIFISYAVIIIL